MRRRKGKRNQNLEDIFDNPTSKKSLLVNDFLAVVTLISILAIVLETVASFSVYTRLFTIIEYGAAAIFTLEYLARLKAAKKKWSYVFSFFGIVDLLAILPTYFGMSNFTFLKAARALRILRFLRMMRLAKLVRISKKSTGGASSLYAVNIQIYGVTLLIALIFLGTLFYFFEGHTEAGKDIPSGMYWTFIVLLGDIPYSEPVTLGGTITVIGTRFVSMILLGLMLSLLGTMLRKVLIGSENDA